VKEFEIERKEKHQQSTWKNRKSVWQNSTLLNYMWWGITHSFILNLES